MKTEIAIIGGGPAGLAAAVAAREAGVQDILIIERDNELGGILNQCIHNGFGLHTFKEELTGPEYAGRYIEKVKEMEIPYLLHTIVVDVSRDKVVTVMNKEQGLFQIEAKAVILAMGCRERSRGALNIPGYRPAGIYSAGTAQRYVNMEGRMPGKKVVILGSGDIGLIMARRMTLEGAKVQVVAELMVDIKGKKRVEGVTLAQVDENRKLIPGTEEYYDCDTLLLSCGLIPENELSSQIGVEQNPVTSGPVVNESLETNVDGVFACGNVLHVHDLVDYVSGEAKTAGENAAAYVQGNLPEAGKEIPLKGENGVRYTVPCSVDVDRMTDKQVVRFRVGNVYRDKYLCVYYNDKCISRVKKKVMAPGEMEQVILLKSKLKEFEGLESITIRIEEEEQR